MNIALIILAAGDSSRLGQPKQLLLRGDQSMIEYMVSECTQSELGPVYVVTGKYHMEISNQIVNTKILYNENWQEGMSSSIAFAISNIDLGLVDGAIIILSDQVHFEKNILAEITRIVRTNKYKIINCQYDKGLGPPTYFDKTLFVELANLKGENGAKEIVKKYITDCVSIDFPNGGIDLDTEEDLDILRIF